MRKYIDILAETNSYDECDHDFSHTFDHFPSERDICNKCGYEQPFEINDYTHTEYDGHDHLFHDHHACSLCGMNEEHHPDYDGFEADIYESKSFKSYLTTVVTEGYGNSKIHNLDVHEFIDGYIAAMLFSTSDESKPDGGEPMDKNYSKEDFSPETMDRIEADCRAFLHKTGPFITKDKYNGALLGSLESYAGHDFWLTRVGHGAGFWDGDWKNEESNGILTKNSKSFGLIDPYIGDDGKIYLS